MVSEPGVTDTVKFCGVVPLPGVTDNHELPDVTDAVTLLACPVGLVSTLRVWLAGAAVPVVQLKVMLAGTVSRGMIEIPTEMVIVC